GVTAHSRASPFTFRLQMTVEGLTRSSGGRWLRSNLDDSSPCRRECQRDRDLARRFSRLRSLVWNERPLQHVRPCPFPRPNLARCGGPILRPVSPRSSPTSTPSS